MILDWQVPVVEPDRPSGDQPRRRTLAGLGPAARQVLGSLRRITKLILGTEIVAGADRLAVQIGLLMCDLHLAQL